MHPTIAEIDLAALFRNMRRIVQRVQPSEVMAVVKADAYGHGAVPCARTLLRAGATRLAVAYPAEGAELRAAGIEAPIHVFAGYFAEQIPEFLEHHLELTVSNDEQLRWLRDAAARARRPVPVHVKFDTGMGRVGFPWEQAPDVFQRLRECPNVQFVGLMTHFSTADEADKSFAREQLLRFQAVIDAARRLHVPFQYWHAANSAAILDLPETWFNLVRPGVMMYGYYPSDEVSHSVKLEPVLRWTSRILQVKTVEPGTPVSYGRTWEADRATTVATVPVGYADGYRRSLSNRMHALVRGRRVPVVGRVCMDMIMLDLGPDAKAAPGDEVVLLGQQGDAQIDMTEFCRALDTIPYEITCMIGKRVPRVFVNEDASGSRDAR
ncbi:MAG: alanine racemase [candidate division KSB1 bacterium]|nr:alanine racemase [candidate division KSB1 bacterium]